MKDFGSFKYCYYLRVHFDTIQTDCTEHDESIQFTIMKHIIFQVIG
jgi:hypothetical protein